MKKMISIVLLALCCATVFAKDVMTPVSLISILKRLNAQSQIVIKLEYKHHAYEAKVITPQGFLQEIKFDKNGNLLSNKNDDTTKLLSMASVLALIEKEGYSRISSVKISGHRYYKIRAISSTYQKEVNIKVNAQTGEIKVQHEWWDIF
jgi:uncharacterized membrane protein YkoI